MRGRVFLRSWRWLFLLAAFSTWTMRAYGQDLPEPEGYREAVDEAVAEFASHHFEEARALFARAHALFPNARTHRGLGMAEFELRNYGECVQHFEAALASTVRPLDEALRANTEELLRRSNGFVARFTVQTTPRPFHVAVDGVGIEPGNDAAIALILLAGEHVLELEAAGFAPVKRHLSAQGGETRTLLIAFDRALQRPSASNLSDAPPVERRWYKSPWLWAAVGAVVAGAVTGTVVAMKQREREPEPYGGTAEVVVKALVSP